MYFKCCFIFERGHKLANAVRVLSDLFDLALTFPHLSSAVFTVYKHVMNIAVIQYEQAFLTLCSLDYCMEKWLIC